MSAGFAAAGGALSSLAEGEALLAEELYGSQGCDRVPRASRSSQAIAASRTSKIAAISINCGRVFQPVFEPSCGRI